MAEPRQPACTIRLDHALAMRLTGYAIALLYIAIGIAIAFDPSGSHEVSTMKELVLGGFGAIGVCVGTIILHELVHGAVMRMFGATPKYGVGRTGWLVMYAYATAPGVPFTLNQMVAICLAPLVVISAGAFATGWLVPPAAGFAALAFVVNFSGAAGDLWFVRQMWRFRRCRDLSLVDTETSLEVYTSDPAASTIAAAVTAPSIGIVQRLLTRWLLASSVILVAVIPVTVLLTVAGAEDLSIGPAQYSVAKYSVAPDGGVSLSVDINVVIVAGLLFALVSLLLVPRMRRRPPSGNPAAPHPVFL